MSSALAGRRIPAMYDALVAMEAPPAIIAWVSSTQRYGESTANLIRAAGEPTWLPWMLAAAGLPLRAVCDTAIAVTTADVGALDSHRMVLTEALDAASRILRHEGSPEETIVAAERAEEIAVQPNTVYRSTTPSPLVSELAWTVAFIARASEGLFAAELALETRRLVDAHRSGALVGVGTNAMVGPERALRIAGMNIATDPVLQSAIYVPAALAEAVSHLAASRAITRGGAPRDVGEELAMELREPLTDLLG